MDNLAYGVVSKATIKLKRKKKKRRSQKMIMKKKKKKVAMTVVVKRIRKQTSRKTWRILNLMIL
jgi:hypothetical protein